MDANRDAEHRDAEPRLPPAPYPMRALAAQLRALGDQGYALAEKAMKVAQEEAERKR